MALSWNEIKDRTVTYNLIEISKLAQVIVMNSTPTIETTRSQVSSETSQEIKTELGQFLTPYSTALFMSSLYSNLTKPNLKLLDPGAGTK